jgi:hypothetical protein
VAHPSYGSVDEVYLAVLERDILAENALTFAECLGAPDLPGRRPSSDGTGPRRQPLRNYAISALGRLAPATGHEYIAVYDADAVPDCRLRVHVARAAAGRPAMIQQPMLPAFPVGIGERRSAVMSGQYLAAFRRAIGIEYRRIKVARWWAPGSGPRVLGTLMRPMVYGVGSGLIVRRDKIEDIGFFQEPHDDLAVGHRLSMAGERIAVLPSVNVVEPYQSVASMARAFSSVAFANTATRRDYRFAAARPTLLSRAGQRLPAGLPDRDHGEDRQGHGRVSAAPVATTTHSP